MADISKALSYMGVSLEKSALDAFGAAVNNQVGGGELSKVINSGAANLANAFGANFGGARIQGAFNAPLASNNGRGGVGQWAKGSMAAVAASGAGGYDPKNRFLFRVSFTFNEDVASAARQIGVDLLQQINRNLTFIMKSIDMPSYSFTYEDVNYYNFRSKVLTRITHDELSFEMYDDTGNTGIKFLNSYLQLLSPITRQNWTTNFNLEDFGMALSSGLGSTGPDSASRGVFGANGNAKNILSQMIIDQYYLDRSNQNLGGQAIRQAVKVNRFIFTNPRLMSFNVDELSYDNGTEASSIKCSFDYDAIKIEDGELALDVAIPADGLMEAQDILSDRSTQIATFTDAPGGNGSGPVRNTIVSPSANQLIQGAIKAFDIGGGQRNATTRSIVGLVGTLSGALSRTVNNNGITPGITPPISPIIEDSTLGNINWGQITNRIPRL